MSIDAADYPEMVVDNIYSDYLKQISVHDIYLYGAGKYGQQAMAELEKQGLTESVRGFLETGSKPIGTTVCGKPVFGIDDADIDFGSTSIVITMAEKKHAEIRKLLALKGAEYVFSGMQLIFDSYRVREKEWAEHEAMREDYLKHMAEGNPLSNIKASHVTYPLVGNAGDTYLSWCVRKYLGFGSWNIIKVSDPVTEETIESINNTDILIIGGGGLFLPDSNENAISGWQWAISDELLDKIKVPIVVYSVGYNYFDGQAPSSLFINSLNHLVRKAAFVGLRNHGSIERINDLLEDDLKSKVVYQPCITTIMDHVVQAKKTYECAENNKKSLNIAVNIAFDRADRRFGKAKEQILSELADAMRTLEQKGHTIIFAAHCDKDTEFLHYLDDAGVGYIKKNLTRALPDEIMEFYRDEADIVIGMRGHSQMIPFGFGKPLITLASHDKMRWFLEDTGIELCCVDLRSSAETIAQRIIGIFDTVVTSAELSQKLDSARKQLFDISEQNKAEIKGLLGEI